MVTSIGIMEEQKIKKWVRVIAIVELMSSMVGMCFHVLIQSGIIQETLNWVVLFDFYFNTAAGLIIFAGLWHPKPWGWRVAVLLIPISYLFVLYDYINDYFAWIGLFYAPFVLLDVFILRFLFKPEVMTFCRVSSRVLSRMRWLPNALLDLAIFFVVSAFGNELIGIGVVVAVFLGFSLAKRYRKKNSKPEDVTTASTGSAIDPASR